MKYWKHKKTENIYKIKDFVLVEHPDTHEWVQGIVYSTVYAKSCTDPSRYVEAPDSIKNRSFVRTQERFMDRFEQIDEADIKL